MRESEPEESDGSEYIMLPERPPEPDPEHFYVHPSNWTAFQIFEACRTQWRLVVGMSGVLYQGLEYPSVMAVITAWGVKNPRKVFRQVRLLEIGALSVINEQ